SIINNKKQTVLYIPFASNTRASALRTWLLSLAAKDLKVMFVLRYPMDKMTKIFLKMSGAEIVSLSKESYRFYKKEIGRAIYLKTGIDTKQFFPVSENEKLRIRKKYAVSDGKKVLLHVGHLKSGRNVDKLL